MAGQPFANQLILLFFSALFLSLWLTPVVNRIAFRFDAIDRPDERKVHTQAVSRLGGLAMIGGLAVPLAIFVELDRTLLSFLFGAVVVAAVGFADDVFHISPKLKFLGEAVAAAVFVGMSGAQLFTLGDFLGIGEVRTGFLAPAVTVFCMVGVMNALNLSDGLDGLAGGISAIACVFLGSFAYWRGDWLSLSILTALLGAVFGFLRHNTYPANSFMGDTGSLLLGYALSAAAVMLVQYHGSGIALSPVTVAGVLALPIVDTLLVMLRRLRHGENPFLPDRTHLHHRLMEMGLPHAAVVPVLYIGSGLFGIQAWFQRSIPDGPQFAFILILCFAVYGTVFFFRRDAVARKVSLVAGRTSNRNGALQELIASMMRKTVRPVAWGLGIGLFLPTVFLVSVPKHVGMAALAGGVGVALLFPWRSRFSKSSISHGMLYGACVFLLSIFQLVRGMPTWMPRYFAVLSGIAIVWALLKMRYSGHKEVLFFSGFEILMIGISLIIPVVLIPALGFPDYVGKTMSVVVLESIALLLAMKILIRRQPINNFVLTGSFLIAMAILVAQGILAGDDVFAHKFPQDPPAGSALRENFVPFSASSQNPAPARNSLPTDTF